jgi:hypothetical protein
MKLPSVDDHGFTEGPDAAGARGLRITVLPGHAATGSSIGQ